MPTTTPTSARSSASATCPASPAARARTCARLRRRLERFRGVPPVRALIGDLRAAEERQERGEPAHLADMIVRLMRVTVARNTELEVRSANERDASVRELEALRQDVVATVRRSAAPWRRRAAVAEVQAHFAGARFPFRHDRALPLTIVRGDPGEDALDSTFRTGLEWPMEDKRALVARGYEQTDAVLRERRSVAGTPPPPLGGGGLQRRAGDQPLLSWAGEDARRRSTTGRARAPAPARPRSSPSCRRRGRPPRERCLPARGPRSPRGARPRR